MLADMPFVTAAMLARVAAREGTAAPMVVSRYGDVTMLPILYDRSLFAELLALPGQACGKEMVRRHRAEAVALSWPENALADIDRPEDYQRIASEARGCGRKGSEPDAARADRSRGVAGRPRRALRAGHGDRAVAADLGAGGRRRAGHARRRLSRLGRRQLHAPDGDRRGAEVAPRRAPASGCAGSRIPTAAGGRASRFFP